MLESENSPIVPQSAPLSHLKKPQQQATTIDRRVYYVIAMVILVLAISLTLWDDRVATVAPIQPATAIVNPIDTQLPFANTQRTIARERAQKSLAQFVEFQLQLEEKMQIQSWGEVEFSQALQAAELGDLEFANENYDAAISAYEEAANFLGQLIDDGIQRVQTLLAEARSAVEQREQATALARIQEIRTIQPDNSALASLEQRAQLIPNIVDLLRVAKNQELQGAFQAAINTYNSIEKLDSETFGLSQAMQSLQSAALKQKVTLLIGQGFRQLDTQSYDAARSSFREALIFDPNDSIARGGLEQVAKANDLNVIAQQRARAQEALKAEQWPNAIDAYSAILSLDKNIQFAVNGLAEAKSHATTESLLSVITQEPTKLSSQALFLEAQTIVATAKELSHRGQKINTLIDQTAELLRQYKDPVLVQLVSDDATDIIISNIGRLGAFAEKQLSMRPGQYTIRGSQDGCRD
ncbi:MAG: tetratricopeptide (TPR) repeat protein, partial [Limisphaerales bacterium]